MVGAEKEQVQRPDPGLREQGARAWPPGFQRGGCLRPRFLGQTKEGVAGGPDSRVLGDGLVRGLGGSSLLSPGEEGTGVPDSWVSGSGAGGSLRDP